MQCIHSISLWHKVPVPNPNFEIPQSIAAAVSTIRQLDFSNKVESFEIDAPPWVHLSLRMGARPSIPLRVFVTIDSTL